MRERISFEGRLDARNGAGPVHDSINEVKASAKWRDTNSGLTPEFSSPWTHYGNAPSFLRIPFIRASCSRSDASTRDQSVLTYFVYHRWYTELLSAGCCNKKHKNISRQVWNINNYKRNKITNRKSHTQAAINASKIDRSKATRQRNHWTSPVNHRSTQGLYFDDKITWKSIFYSNMSRRETIPISPCVSNG